MIRQHKRKNGSNGRKGKAMDAGAGKRVEVRALIPRDIEAVMQIDEKIKRRPTANAYWESKLADFMERDPNACLAAVDDGRVVGFILGEIRGWEVRMERSGWIEVLGVDPGSQGRGIGRQLVEALLEYFRQSGVEHVDTLLNWNDTDLVEYFRSVGFHRGDFVHLRRPL